MGPNNLSYMSIMYCFLQDDTHVLINPAYVNYLKEEVTRLFDQNTFERKD